ncbi:hypothetical protein [Methylotuvimicrobium alcaliphilum]|uniref:Lipoprotein n=1 Tax=Methylotuvimicrobium alcaliphilum (strain DSM 19304 / NCIMB 14124 / VKM B-2133 / 20Z) TaxID=1091494 RepID=G4T1T0_META2|nr:hypothetical protein [Methylotuvimicrobium alcaliphilum]CCE23512.1 conserved exported protein of unknown function [Methylotuvimicrobium alcaliphilum 20Z]
MRFRDFFLLQIAGAVGLVLTGCSTSRQIAVDYPVAQANDLKPLGGYQAVDGDDYYVQLFSEFELKGDSTLKTGCSEIGSGYEKGSSTAGVVFKVKNEALNYKQEVTALVYQGSSGKCNFNLETRKAALTPWLRLDLSKDTTIDYQFMTSNQSDTDISKIIGDVHKSTNLLALTGVGIGIAMMGKLADEWVQSPIGQTAVSAPSEAKVSTETHTLPLAIQSDGNKTVFRETRLPVYEVVEGGNPFSGGPKQLGELRIYPEIRSSLLLKQVSAGIPSARDVSLQELLSMPIRMGEGNIELRQLLENSPIDEKPNLQPDWRKYGEVESQCRKLKRVLRGLGFNKFDRNAVLYYYLAQSPDWSNYNIPKIRAIADDLRPATLQQFRSRNFSGCLIDEDYQTMAMMGLSVNSAQDWQAIQDARQKKESVLGPVQSIGRQLTSVIQNKNPAEMARQIYPLIATPKEGGGKVLLQNHLGEFGLESMLGIDYMPGEGIVIGYQQFEQVFSWLYIDQLSCTRPAIEQGKPLGHIGLLMFTTQDGSPWPKGGAIEFEIQSGKISRIAFQHPTFRDFEQSLNDYPEIGGCRIDKSFVDRLR